MGESRESRRKWRDVLPGNRLGTNWQLLALGDWARGNGAISRKCRLKYQLEIINFNQNFRHRCLSMRAIHWPTATASFFVLAIRLYGYMAIRLHHPTLHHWWAGAADKTNGNFHPSTGTAAFPAFLLLALRQRHNFIATQLQIQLQRQKEEKKAIQACQDI